MTCSFAAEARTGMYPDSVAHREVCFVSLNHLRNSHDASCLSAVLFVTATTPPNWIPRALPPPSGHGTTLQLRGLPFSVSMMNPIEVLVAPTYSRLPSAKRSCQSKPFGWYIQPSLMPRSSIWSVARPSLPSKPTALRSGFTIEPPRLITEPKKVSSENVDSPHRVTLPAASAFFAAFACCSSSSHVFGCALNPSSFARSSLRYRTSRLLMNGNEYVLFPYCGYLFESRYGL